MQGNQKWKNESLSCVSVLEPITDAKLPYAKYGALVYTKLTLKSATGEEEIIYRSPSYFGTDTSSFSKPGMEQEMEVKRDAQRLEVLHGGNGGTIHLQRFRKTEGRWKLTGEVYTSDFSTMGMGFAPVACEGAALVDFGRVQLSMSNGSKPLLTIDDEGVIWENGRVHEFTKVLKLPGLTQVEFYKGSQQAFLEEYHAPRDAHGVMLAVIERLKESERKKEEKAGEKMAAKKRKK
ncbi:MAG: hypothetical protein NTY98_02710 [Verrucomicrobia bacterium]|nr:hypothetical protein [Verrucomicrobiota bacterium]